MYFELIATPAATLESWRSIGEGVRLGGAQIGDAKVQKCDNDSETGRHFQRHDRRSAKATARGLGEAIGRPLSVNDFAKLCGLPPESGGTILEWENAYGPI